MVIRATFTLNDGTVRFRDFSSQGDADAWKEQVDLSGVYGEPDSYTFKTEDVTAQVEQEQADFAAQSRGEAKQAVGRKAIAMLNQVHEELALPGQDLLARLRTPDLRDAYFLILGGALKEGRALFTAAAGGLYTPEQVARIMKPIDDSGLVQ